MVRIQSTQHPSHLILLLLTALTLALLGCSSEAEPPSGQSSLAALSVDPTFKEFYDRVGGFEILGPPISEMRVVDQFRVQFTSAALLVHVEELLVQDVRGAVVRLQVYEEVGQPVA